MSAAFAITFFRGEAQRLRWGMVPATAITGRVLQFTMRKVLDKLPIDVIKTSNPGGGIEIIDSVNGIADIVLNSDDTAKLLLDAVDSAGNPVLDDRGFQVGIWQADVQWIDTGNEKVPSIGTITLEHPVRNFPV